MNSAGNKAKRFSSVNHTTKTIYQHNLVNQFAEIQAEWKIKKLSNEIHGVRQSLYVRSVHVVWSVGSLGDLN